MFRPNYDYKSIAIGAGLKVKKFKLTLKFSSYRISSGRTTLALDKIGPNTGCKIDRFST